MVFKSSPVWTISTDELVIHIGGLDEPDQIYWDARELKKRGEKFQKLDWKAFPRVTKEGDKWIFAEARN